MLRRRNAARCVYVANPLLLLTVLYYFIHRAIRLEAAYKQSVSHYVFTRSALILCLPGFRNNLAEPQSIGPHLIYSSIFPFGFLLHRRPLKIGLRHLGDHNRSGWRFLSNDGTVLPLFLSLAFPPGI